MRNGCEDVLLNRYERGVGTPRVNKPDLPIEGIEQFEIFGATVIATNKPINDDAMESRTIPIEMPESSRDFENPVTSADALSIRERCLAYRAIHFEQALPEISKPVPKRFGDITKPLVQVVYEFDPKRAKVLVDLFAKMRQDRVQESVQTTEAQVLQVLIDQEQDWVQSGEIRVEKVRELFNLERPDRFHIAPKTAGNIVNSLGFKKKKMTHGMVITWDAEIMDAMKRRYGFIQN